MNNPHVIDILRNYPTGNLCNAHCDVKAMSSDIAALYAGAKIAGPAKTATISPGDNMAIHRAAHSAKPGQVLIIDGAGNRSFGVFGDILATCCQNQGVVGVVIDCTIRDTAEIKEMQFPVFCLGANPTATRKIAPGAIDVEVSCGGICVRPDDIVIGDDDGVVVVPLEIAAHVATGVQAIAARESEIMQQLADGMTTYEIFDLSV